MVPITTIYSSYFFFFDQDNDLIYFLTFDEIGEIISLHSKSSPANQKGINVLCMNAIKRRRLLPKQERMKFHDLIQGKPKPIDCSANNIVAESIGYSIDGTPVSNGNCEGYARVIHSLQDASHLIPGEILICPFTDVGWTPYFSLASGLVTEIGGLLSHGAVVAREYGLPCVVNVTNACQLIVTGMYIRIEGSTGTITVLEDIQRKNGAPCDDK